MKPVAILAVASLLTLHPAAVAATPLPGDWETNPLVAGPVAPGSTALRSKIFTWKTNYTGTFLWSFESVAGTFSTVSYSSAGNPTFSLKPRETTRLNTVGKYSGTFSSGSQLTITTWQMVNVGFQDIWDTIYLGQPETFTASVSVPMANWAGTAVLVLLLGLSAIAAIRRSIMDRSGRAL